MRTSVVLAIAMICATSVDAQVDNCAELLRLSRTTSRTVMDQKVFTRTVDNFCDEARSARATNRSLNVDLRILGIGEGGSSEASTNSAFTKYCQKASDEENRNLNYQQYLDGIDSGAYGAYAACTAARESDAVQYEMGQKPTRDRLVLSVWNRTNTTGATADLEWSGSDPVTCRWTSDEVTPEGRARLKPNERATLECRRSRFDADPIGEQDSVNVIRADGGTAPMLVIPWSKYGSDGNPVVTLDDIRQLLEERIRDLNTEVRALEARARQLIEIRRIRSIVRTRGQNVPPGWEGPDLIAPHVPTRAAVHDLPVSCSPDYDAVDAWYSQAGGGFLETLEIRVGDAGAVEAEVRANRGSSDARYLNVYVLCLARQDR